MKSVSNYKTGQIQGCIDNIKLTLVLTPKKNITAFTLHVKLIINKSFELSVVGFFFNLI